MKVRLRARRHRPERRALEGHGARIDAALGIREHAEFVDGELFCCRHEPLGQARGTVLICPSILFDLTQNYRREVLLARSLAASGVAVQRFHYRGTGHSGGDGSALTLDSMVADALTAAGRLAGGDGPAVLVGTRWGALVAAACARRRPGAALALWEPVISPEAYAREAFRARSASILRDAGPGGASPSSAAAELAATGCVDVLGFELRKALLDSGAGRSLVAELGDSPRPVLLVQLAPRASLRREYGALVDGWRRAGLAVTHSCVPSQDSWWFYQKVIPPSEQLISTTCDWVGGALGRPEAAKAGR